jgi:hypothetical protein
MKRISIITLAILFLSGCSAVESNQEAEKGPINSQLVTSWLNSCEKDTSSKECVDYATDLALYEELIGYDTSGGRFLMADPYIPNEENDYSKPGFIACASSFTGDMCFVNLRIFNRGNEPFQGTLEATMIGKQGTIQATESLYLSSPLNPNTGGIHEFTFETGPNFTGFNYFQLNYFDEIVGEIKLCEYPYNGNVYYYNCLRLENFSYKNGAFILTPSDK